MKGTGTSTGERLRDEGGMDNLINSKDNVQQERWVGTSRDKGQTGEERQDGRW